MSDDEKTIAGVIRIDPEGITIDGVPFPYVVLSEKINVTIDPEGICTVYLPVYADRVELDTPAAAHKWTGVGDSESA